MIDERLRRRFEDKYTVGEPDECWEWTAGRSPQGYGKISSNLYGEQLAHRYAYRIALGRDPGKLCVLHSCDNPPCVNPSHLFLGTNVDNVADRQAKGRGKPPRAMSRDEHPNTRFGQAVVDDMIASYKAGETQASIGARHGTTQRVISKIVRNASGIDGRYRRARGIESGPGRLTDDQVRSIRDRHLMGESQTALAQAFGVSQPSVSAIVLNKTHRNVS